jgi:hypothetical protein
MKKKLAIAKVHKVRGKNEWQWICPYCDFARASEVKPNNDLTKFWCSEYQREYKVRMAY